MHVYGVWHIYYTEGSKQHIYLEETREVAIKMYYGVDSGYGVGKIFGMNKSNVINWIKKSAQKGNKQESTASAYLVEIDVLN